MSEAAKKLEPDQELTLASMAREAFEEQDGNAQLAAEVVTQRLHADRKLLRRVVDREIENIAKFYADSKRRSDNHSIVRASGRNAVVALADGLSRGFLDWRLSDGSRLRDANRQRVVACSDQYQSLADSNGRNARWLRMVAQGMADGIVVGDVYTEERLRELFQGAQHE